MNKKILALLLCGMLAGSALSSCGNKLELTSGDSSGTSDSSEPATVAPPENVEIMNFTAPQKGDKIIEMNIRDYGTVKIRLFPEYAEKGVENFIGLAEKGYYDGLTFHRVIQDFMIQGGDPLGTGMGGESFWGGEFDGGTDPHLIHVAGALAYANSGEVGNYTASDKSQFYIVTGMDITDELFNVYEKYGYAFSANQKAMYSQVRGVPYLDGRYTVFGQVFEGLDIIYKIQCVATDVNDKPIAEDVIIDSVKVSEYNGEELKWYISDYDYDDPMKQPVANFDEPEIGDEIVVMNIKDYGTVKIRVFPELLPQASENFVELARKGYYDGLTFHRIISEFMIQGGDPLGNGTGGESTWGGSFDGGKYYNLIHAAGAVAYANSGEYGNYTASDGSQFYIVTGKVISEGEIALYDISDDAKKVYSTQGGTPFLDGDYTVFGQVIDGLDIIFQVQNVETGDQDKPVKDVIIESMTVEEYDGSGVRWYLSDYDSSEGSTDTEEPTEEPTAEDTTESADAADTTESAE